ncbi:glutathione S-transferase A-like [Pecten maximus]|uniref:glutathione S-transferase A-like n=1 Tax=Pecten maximus TaxID=6579 RepID=UPI001457FACF|nr:glutathione S-transferase A-like [Pecten maximus]
MAEKEMGLIWGSGSGPCFKAMVALHEKEFGDIKKTLISFSEKGHKGPAVIAKNPKGSVQMFSSDSPQENRRIRTEHTHEKCKSSSSVPTFNDGDIVVNESMAILLYLEHTYPNKGTRLLPSDPAGYAKVIQATMEAQENLTMKIMVKCIFYNMMTDEASRKQESFQKAIKANIEEAQKELAIWEDKLKLSDGDFICGKDFTLADVVLFTFLATVVRFGSSLGKFPALKSYYDRLRERPSIKASWPPHWSEGELADEKKILKGI